MQWEVMSKADAAQMTGIWQGLGKDEFESMVSGWELTIPGNLNAEYANLRKEILDAHKKAINEVNTDPFLKFKKEYFTDLKFGIYLYSILEKYGFSVRMASNDQIWMYLCVKVFPDIVHSRYPGAKVKTENGIEYRNINEERFWKTRRRIYLKVLWWYIYLSMQLRDNGTEDLEKTFDILSENSTDEIVQIVERSGPAGYRIDVYRELMKFYAEHRDKYDNRVFRQVMVLNTAKTQIVEPMLMSGGIESYVRELFEYFEK